MKAKHGLLKSIMSFHSQHMFFYRQSMFIVNTCSFIDHQCHTIPRTCPFTVKIMSLLQSSKHIPLEPTHVPSIEKGIILQSQPSPFYSHCTVTNMSFYSQTYRQNMSFYSQNMSFYSPNMSFYSQTMSFDSTKISVLSSKYVL